MNLLVCAALVSFQYGLAPGVKHDYRAIIQLDGFIPIFGGNEGTAVVEIDLHTEGLAGSKAGEMRSSSEITGFRATFNDAAVPLDKDSVKAYFPKTTIRLSAHGKILESDAPDIKLPVRLPGLDVKRFPDITYVPLEFPEKSVEVGERWVFTKMFGESEVRYECRFVGVESDRATIEIALGQSFEVLEDAALEVTTDSREAERRVKTTMVGVGTVVFDVVRGTVVHAHIVNESVGKVTELSDGSTSERRLTTTFDIRLLEEKALGISPVKQTVAEKFLASAKRAWSKIRFGAQIAWQYLAALPFGG